MMIRSTLIAVAMLGLPSSPGFADVFVGDSIYVSGDAGPSFWGSGAPPVPGSDNGSLHIVGGTSLYADSAFGISFTISVTSGAAADGLSGFVTIDYTAFVPGDFIFHQALIGLKDDGSLLSATVAQGPGVVTILDMETSCIIRLLAAPYRHLLLSPSLGHRFLRQLHSCCLLWLD